MNVKNSNYLILTSLFSILFGFLLFPGLSFSETKINKTGLLEDHFLDLLDVETLKGVNKEDVIKSNSVWVFFQQDCASCHAMMKESLCFTKKNNKVFFVGLMSEPKPLLKEARRYGYKGPVLFSKNSIESILNLNVTPTVFIFKKDKLALRNDDYMKCSEIMAKL